MEFKKFHKPRPKLSNNNNRESQYNRPKKDFGPRRNEYIRVPEVRLIDQTGENVGVVKTIDALKMAQEAELDLVEVSPNAAPPVCRIVDFSKYLYEQKKKEREHRTSKKEMKEFKFSPVIDVHDKETRIRRAKEFLNKGHNVRFTMERKGRQNPELARTVFLDILTNFSEYITIEAEPKTEGKRIFITYKPNGKTKN
jgi:translation initiation factor IF-3